MINFYKHISNIYFPKNEIISNYFKLFQIIWKYTYTSMYKIKVVQAEIQHAYAIRFLK